MNDFKFDSVLNGVINNRHLTGIIKELKFYCMILHNIVITLSKFHSLTLCNDMFNKSFVFNYILGLVFDSNIGNEVILLIDKLLI